MKYRRIGTSNLELSEIGFGCGANAGLMQRGSASEQTHTVARALELGINYFDTSPDYDDGVAETNLGRVLKDLKHRPILNTKVNIRAEHQGDIAGHVARSAEASLKRLGVDFIDVLQIRNSPTAVPPNLDGDGRHLLWIDDFLDPGGVLDGMLRLKRSGKIGHIGLVCRGGDGAEVRQLLGTGMITIVNVPYNLLNPSAGRAMPEGLRNTTDFGNVISEAAAHGAGAAVYAPLAGGVLTDATLSDAPRHALARQASGDSEEDQQRAQAVAFLGRDRGLSLAQAAYRFILDHPAVTTALGGFSSLAQVEETAAVAEMSGFTAQEMARLESVWRNGFGV